MTQAQPQFQKLLSFESRARHDDPETSKEAARICNEAGINSVHAAQIVGILLTHSGGKTSRECSDILKIDLSSLSPAFRPLARKGIIREEGTRKNPDTNVKAIVWVMA